jgi:hypothetical protein
LQGHANFYVCLQKPCALFCVLSSYCNCLCL